MFSDHVKGSRLLKEILALILLAAAIGIGINHRLLLNAWHGTAVSTVPAGKGSQAAIPLPLGIMQVKELFDSKEAVIIDSRARHAYAEGHIAGALSLPLMEADAQIADLLKKVPASAMLVLYCNGYACEDSIDLGRKLIAAGYGSVYYFDGGFPAWRDADYPIAGGGK